MSRGRPHHVRRTWIHDLNAPAYNNRQKVFAIWREFRYYCECYKARKLFKDFRLGNVDSKMECPLYNPVNLKKNNRVSPAFFAELFLCSLQVTLWAGHPKSQTVVPDGWPTRLDKRKLYPSKYGFIYAARKSAVVEVNKVIGTVLKNWAKTTKTRPQPD